MEGRGRGSEVGGWCGETGRASRVRQAQWKSMDRGHLSSWLSIAHTVYSGSCLVSLAQNLLFCAMSWEPCEHILEFLGSIPVLALASGGLECVVGSASRGFHIFILHTEPNRMGVRVCGLRKSVQGPGFLYPPQP